MAWKKGNSGNGKKWKGKKGMLQVDGQVKTPMLLVEDAYCQVFPTERREFPQHFPRVRTPLGPEE